MARGAAQQENLLNKQAGTQFQNAQNTYGQAAGGYAGVLAQPGFTPSQVNTQMNAAIAPVAGKVASSEAQLGNRAAATRNTAGMVAGQRAIARGGAEDLSQAAYGVQAGADKEALQNKMQALSGLSGLYGTASGSAGNLYGEATKAMDARAGVNQTIMGYINAATGAANAFKKKD
jgi:hypothetical protein